MQPLAFYGERLPEMLASLQEMHADNPRFVGWAWHCYNDHVRSRCIGQMVHRTGQWHRSVVSARKKRGRWPAPDGLTDRNDHYIGRITESIT